MTCIDAYQRLRSLRTLELKVNKEENMSASAYAP